MDCSMRSSWQILDLVAEGAFLALDFLHVPTHQEGRDVALMSEKKTSPKKLKTPPMRRPAVLLGTTSP